MKEFNVLTVPLEGSNLIEASAGTGKTFSIGIMVLRLLLEQKLPIEAILMVTFTKAAVAELEGRIREFVKTAYQYSLGEIIAEPKIKEIIDRTDDKETAKDLLRQATHALDELSVSTIHGFCQQCLTEFAFETDQLFGVNIIENYSELLTQEVNRFWRNKITTIEPYLLQLLSVGELSRKEISNIVSNHLNGKKYFFFDPQKQYDFPQQIKTGLSEEIRLKANLASEAENELNNYFQTEIDAIHRRVEGLKINGNTKRAFLNKLEPPDPVAFFSFLSKKREEDFADVFSDLLALYDKREQANQELSELMSSTFHHLYAYALQEIQISLSHRKEALNLISFDDMIRKMAGAMEGPKGDLLGRHLRKKYKAVFIDEFQDTDQSQYSIFSKAFQSDAQTILFYIGDPKQSIYGWRNADIYTYFEARNTVSHQYTMNTNYRSKKDFVESVNRFFLSVPDPFAFEEESPNNRIDFHEVLPNKEEQAQMGLYYDDQPKPPMVIIEQDKKEDIPVPTAELILQLLADPRYKIFEKNDVIGRKVLPSDIGLLVRTNKEANKIKRELSRRNIPAVTIDDKQIFKSEEAANLVIVLNTFLSPSLPHVNNTLLTPFIGWKIDDIKKMDKEQMIALFRQFGNIWKEKGIFSALKSFITAFKIQERLLYADTARSNSGFNGERIVTNLMHLQELLFKAETRQQLKATELISWLKRHNANAETGDETIQRIESDEASVQIITIHKSKGLEFPIIVAPFLDLSPKREKPEDTFSFRSDTGDYYLIRRREADAGQIETAVRQERQENRRLLYVAITRAKFNCFVFKARNARESALSVFTDKIDYGAETRFFEQSEIKENQSLSFRSPIQQQTELSYGIDKNNPFLTHQNWRLMSYSGLAAEHQFERKARYEATTDNYDRFIFEDLGRGTRTGTFLHEIMEQLDFTKPGDWEEIIKRNLRYFDSNQKEQLEKYLPEYLHQVLDCPIPTDKEPVILSTVSKDNCLHEMEFNKIIGSFSPERLNHISGTEIKVKPLSESQGPLIGFIDLFFQSGGRYYILDWKSNYLGPGLDDYTSEAVKNAMNVNNYHLQYLLYTYAMRQYLSIRLGSGFNYETDFGGVIYLFLRGVRKNRNTGIFFTKPSTAQLEEIRDIFKE